MRRLIYLSIAIAALHGAAQAQERLKAPSATVGDEFSPTVKVTPSQWKLWPIDNPDEVTAVIAPQLIKSKSSGTVSRFIALAVQYGDKGARHYDKAYDDSANNLELEVIKVNVQRCVPRAALCVYNESLFFPLTNAHLILGELNGLKFKVSSRNGRGFVVSLPKEAFIELIAAEKALSGQP